MNFPFNDVREDIQVLRTEYDEIKIEEVIAEAIVTVDEDARPKRATERKLNSRLKDILVNDQMPNRDDANLRQIVVQSIDMIEDEFKSRFAHNYIEI